MLLKAALTSAIARLTTAQVPSPRMNAELLLRFTLGCDRAYIFAHSERELTSAEQLRYEEALSEPARGVLELGVGDGGADPPVIAGILDPVKICRNAISNAVSIASTMLTTEAATRKDGVKPMTAGEGA